MKKFLAFLLVLTSCAFYVPAGFAEGEDEFEEVEVEETEEANPDRVVDEYYIPPLEETEQEKDAPYEHFEDFETQEGMWPPGWYFSKSAVYYGSRGSVKNGKLNLVHAGNGYQFRSNRKLDGVFNSGTVLVSFDLEIVKKAEKGDAFPKIGQEAEDALSVEKGTTCMNFNLDMFNFLEENDEGGKTSTHIPMKIEDGGKYKMGFVIDLDNKKQSFYMVDCDDYEYYELTDRGFYDREASYIDGIHFLMTSNITSGATPEYNIDNLRICQKDDVTYGEFQNMFFEENQMKTDRLEDIKYLIEKNDFMLMVDSPYCITKRKRVLVDENNNNVTPVILGDSTMVPIRFISEKLGATVSYNDAEEKVTINYKDKTIEIKIGESRFTLNGEVKQIPAAAVVRNDRTLVPLRSISEAFDKDVLWDDSGLITVCDDGELVGAKIDKEKGRIIKTFGIYVSPNGDDGAAGTKANPLKTLDGAKEFVKKLRTTSGIPEGGITVWFSSGTYFIDSGMTFTGTDSGSAESPVNYRVLEGHEAEITSAVRLEKSDFKKVTDESILARLYPTVRNKVLAVDLKKKGFTKLDSLKHYRTSYVEDDEITGYAMLITDGYRETLARWPNGTFAKTQAIRNSSQWPGGCFEVSLDCPIDRWVNAEEPWLAGSLKWGWGFESVPVELDATEKTVTILKRIYANMESNKDYYILNLIEEIDIPGEWYIDRKNLILYYYPSKDISKSDIRLTGKTNDDLLIFDDASFINFHGFSMAGGIDHGLLIKNGSNHINLEDCRFEHFALQAAVISDGDYITFKDCDFLKLMDGAVTIEKCGNRETLRGGEVKFENCYFTDCNGLNKMGYMIRFQPNSVGVKVINCEFAGAPHQMLYPDGNSHWIENCEIYDGVKDSYDSGAIYKGRSWAVRGTTLKNNVFHGNYGITASSSDTWSIYWDDGLGGQSMISNLFYDSKKGDGIKGGYQDGYMDSNVFIEMPKAGFKNVVTPPVIGGVEDVYKHADALINSAKAVPYQNPFWVHNFPELQQRMDNPDYKYNNWHMVNNITINCPGGFMDCAEEFYENDFYRDYLNNIVEGNRDFVDSDIVGRDGNYNFQVLKELDIEGFKAPDIDKMGVKLSENRKEYPAPDKFELIYPTNGQRDLQMKGMEFVWRPTPGTVLNKITIATDEEFKNIVYEKEIYCKTADVPEIEWEYGETTYYWKVESIDHSINSDGARRCEKVFSFTTARDEALDMLGYERAVTVAKDLLEDAPVGEETGNVPQEVWDSLSNLITGIDAELNSGKFISGGTLEEYIAQINEEIAVFKKKRKPGTVELLDYLDINSSSWAGPDPNNIIRKDGNLMFASNKSGSSNVYGYREIMPNYPIWKFNAIFNLSDLSSGWQAISLRASGATSTSWSGGYCYICIIKPDVIELQQFGNKRFYDTVPNTFIESGKEYTIEYGAYDTEEGVQLIFKVDGQTVFEKLDTENYNDVEGYISFVAPQNQLLTLKKSY